MQAKDKKPTATVLGSSLNNKHDEEEDDYEDEPWEADESKDKKAKANPFD